MCGLGYGNGSAACQLSAARTCPCGVSAAGRTLNFGLIAWQPQFIVHAQQPTIPDEMILMPSYMGKIFRNYSYATVATEYPALLTGLPQTSTLTETIDDARMSRRRKARFRVN